MGKPTATLFGAAAFFLPRDMIPKGHVKTTYSIASYSAIITDRASVAISEKVRGILEPLLPPDKLMKAAIQTFSLNDS